MKTLILSLAAFLLTVTSYGQTLKWTHAIAQPPFNVDESQIISMRHDTLGNFGFSISYYTQAGEGAQFTWIAANGKLIFTIVHTAAEGVNSPHVLAVSANTFLVAFANSTYTSWTLRKYTKRGSAISHRDIVLGAREYPASFTEDDSKAVGPTYSTFFVVGTAQDGTPITIKRYTVK